MAIKTTLHNTRENPYTFWPGWQISSTTMVITMRIPQNLKQEQPYDPAVPLTGMYLKDSKLLLPQRPVYPCLVTIDKLYYLAIVNYILLSHDYNKQIIVIIILLLVDRDMDKESDIYVYT